VSPYRERAVEAEIDAAVADLRASARELHASGSRIRNSYGAVWLSAKLRRLLDAFDAEGDRLERVAPSTIEGE
jgi:hypothetical protein